MWNRVDGAFRKWKGPRPKRAPIHNKWRCRWCKEDVDKEELLSRMRDGFGSYSVCCDSETDEYGLYCGGHDDTCVCKDCK